MRHIRPPRYHHLLHPCYLPAASRSTHATQHHQTRRIDALKSINIIYTSSNNTPVMSE